MTNTNIEFNPFEDPFTRRLAKWKATQLVGKYGFSDTDRDDIEQDIYVHVLQRWSSYDPAEGHHHKFITAVIERFMANFVRDRQAIKRCDSAVGSLQSPMAEPGEDLSVGQAVSNNGLDGRLGRRRRGSDELAGMRIDMDALLKEFPAQWQEVLELRKSLTVTEISERLNIPRTTINAWIRKVRERFAEVGLDEYFDLSSSHRT
ncbi:MAG: sigma-70 family RNA polymerase sigma factor [Rubripirellula sp.]